MLSDQSPRTTELPRPKEIPCPYESEYQTDVLVVGCGFAGLNAAYRAKIEGSSVLVVDKGRPGYSGLSPWPSSFRWFDPERGDVEEAYRKAVQVGGDYICNMRWLECWLRESKDMFHRLTDWGILTQYPRAAETGDYYHKEDFVGYREYFDRFDRRKKWIEVLNANNIPYLEHTMINDVLVEDSRVVGALGFHVQSGQIIRIQAKAVILATAGGVYKPTGYPVGGISFDGVAIAYELGLPIAGMEFEDFHGTSSAAPGNALLDNHWQYLENIWLCGGDINEENAIEYAATKGDAMVMGRIRDSVRGSGPVTGEEIADLRRADFTRRGGSVFYGTDPLELRSGKLSTPVAAGRAAGGATGMCSHLTSGVFCGLDDEDGATDIDGLFTAGDGIHATAASGSAYPCGVGFTSCFCSIDGDHAGAAAARYAGTVDARPIPEELLKEKEEALTTPYRVERGLDPNWARDVLHAFMAPYWVLIIKSEPMLKAALAQVQYMRSSVEPKLMARTGHDLRLVHEVKHKLLAAEMKLRASLVRRESRGNHYREDYPFRDDDKFLCYITVRKTPEGMVTEAIPLPEEWLGDKKLPYAERYLYFFPKELETKGVQPLAGDEQNGMRGGGR